MAGAKSQARVYLRPLYACKHQHRWRNVPIPEGADPVKVNELLDILKDRESAADHFFRRLREALIGMGYSFTDAEDALAQRLGWATFGSMSKSCIVKPERVDLVLERRKAQREHDARRERADEVDRIKNLRKIEKRKELRGRYATMTAAEGQQYFFVDHPEYVQILENLMRDHTDVWLEGAVNEYPNMPMTWDEFNKSFGAFWRTVLKFRLKHSGIFHEPGLEAVKRLAYYLYTWSFRRYLIGEIIVRHASYLTREFRIAHVSIVRDTVGPRAVDAEYTYTETDPEEEEGDDIGNRV